mmetsp:Transcript_9022/g.8430  ORF Transcript_9022/g.8430 Transcript_9022/m.8430 type:complete len:108 (-) Transcript_9022:1406-1729(-)
MELLFNFNKEMIGFANEDKLVRMTLENIADTENVIVIQKDNGDVRIMSEKIHGLMVEYALNKKLEEAEGDDEDQEPPRNIFERVMNAVFGDDDDEPVVKKNKASMVL